MCKIDYVLKFNYNEKNFERTVSLLIHIKFNFISSLTFIRDIYDLLFIKKIQ